MEQPVGADFEVYIVGPEDTLAGIALSRRSSIAEIKQVNKLWGNTIFPGQRLRVRKKRDRASPDPSAQRQQHASSGGGAGKRESAGTGTSVSGGAPGAGGSLMGSSSSSSSSALPLLVRLRDLFDQRDTLYAHHVVPRPVLPTRVTNTARLHLKVAPQLVSADDSRVLTIAAVLLRLHPFLAVNGSMTLTSTRLIFLPNLQDPHVRKLGSTMLQVDVPIANITGVKRVQAAELDTLVTEDVGLRLQEEQRFLDVIFRTDKGNIVVAPRAMKKKNETRKKMAGDEDNLQSLHFMLSPESMSVVRSKLVQHLEEANSSAVDGVPTLVGGEKTSIPTTRDLLELLPHIPPMFQGISKWYVRFATQIDGVSRTTLAAKVSDVTPLLLFVKTRKGETFGAFIGDELKYRHEHYGSDRSFLFRFNPFNVWFPAAERAGYFLLVNERGISIGTDASGRVALFVDDELSSGETQSCAVFNNEPLCDSGIRFEIAALEFYAFEPPS